MRIQVRAGSRVAVVGLAVCLLATLAGVWPARAATVTVNTLNDDNGISASTCTTGGTCTLRGALIAASSGDTIAFSVSGTIPLTNGTLPVVKNLTIQGAGAIAVSGQNAVRVFQVGSGVQATMDGLTIQNGRTTNSNGGGIANAGTLTVSNSTIAQNQATAADGGAIDNTGTLTVANSTLSGNTATSTGAVIGSAGAIMNAGTLIVAGSTLSSNTAPGGDGGSIKNTKSGSGNS